MSRTTYYSGSLRIELEQTGVSHDGRDVFSGSIILSDGRRWDFTDLGSGCGGCRSEISMAESAISFGSYYDATECRGDDVPEWAPAGDLASAIGDNADYTPEELPEGERKGHTDDNGSVYWGDLYTVFDSLDSQRAWYRAVWGE